MARFDPYDVRIAFDDVYGCEASAPGADARERVACVMGAMMDLAKRRRLAPPEFEILGASYDPTYKQFEVEDVAYRIIGAEYEPKYKQIEIEDVAYQIIGGVVYEPKYKQIEIEDVNYQIIGLPLFDSIRGKFERALPKAKHVRVDDEKSYGEFREARRKPHLEEVEKRLAELERALSAHTADNHGGGRLDDLEERFERHLSEGHFSGGVDVLGAAADRAMVKAAQGGQRVPLPLPAWARSKVECWADGPETLCTVKVMGPDGGRMLTSGMSAARHLDEVLGCGMAIGAEPDEILFAAPAVAQALCGAALVNEICGAAGEIFRLSNGTPGFVGVMKPDADATVAAAMALLQRCQRGDARACAEAAELKRSKKKLFRAARDRLVRAQEMKARRAS